MREAFRWDFIWSDVRALSFCTMGSKSFWGRIWILGSLSFHEILTYEYLTSGNDWKKGHHKTVMRRAAAARRRLLFCQHPPPRQLRPWSIIFECDFEKTLPLLCNANLRSLRMTNANTLTTKSTSLSFKRNLKSRRVYFQMSNPLILYAKKPMALVE